MKNILQYVMNNTSSKLYKELNTYCKHQCQHIIVKFDHEHIYYYKGKYKGYLYVLKLTSYCQKYRLNLNSNELYNLLKLQKNTMLGKYHKEPLYIKGILHSLYDCLNYISQ